MRTTHPSVTFIGLVASVLLAASAVAQPANDPLKSAACGEALQALDAARATGDRSAIELRRGAAARACFGGPQAPAATGRVAKPPDMVPGPQIATPMSPPGVLPAPPPVVIGRPPGPAQCDGAGCWVNDGSHLRLIPSPALGSRGPCTTVGSQVHCP